MTTVANQSTSDVTQLLNGTLRTLKNVLPVEHSISKPTALKSALHVNFAVLIGITGNIKGNLVINGDSAVFGMIGEKMFGMPLEGEMLKSFAGEMGNMMAGGISTSIAEEGIQVDITAPAVLEGDTKVSGFEKKARIE